MPVDEEYELLPHEEVEQLRKDVERLKKNPLGEGKDSKDLLVAINDLRHAIEILYQVFSQANQEMVQDYRSTSIKEHFRLISNQNERIAQGILSVAEMLKDMQLPPQPMQSSSLSSPPPSPSSPMQQSTPTYSSKPPLGQPPLQGFVAPDPTSIIPDDSGLIGDPITSRAAFETQQMMQSSQQYPSSQMPPPQQPLFSQTPPLNIPPPPPKKKGFGLFK